MDWKDIGRSLVSQGAPLLGGLLGGPAGTSAGKMVAGLFDVDPENPEEVMNAIQVDPESIAKIRAFEQEHRIKLQELQLEETKAFLADVDSARRREAAIVAATGEKDHHLYYLAYIVVAAFFLLTLLLAIGQMNITTELGKAAEKLGENPLIMMIVGGLISGFTQVLSYFFGSSKGSAEKNKIFTAKG
ncbi:hypothetical protein ACFL6N_02270 [Thermodesulfobacteriota bacterium]